ncbi:MAG: hypothetical protein RIR12_1443 [Bacteroidota bacterium]|jgi:hypothetical protein
MKKNFITIIFLVIACIATAQVPPAFNYQAVARNSSGVALANQTIKVRLSILQSSTMIYSETRTVTTNALGLFNVQIGAVGASNVTGSISAIDWGNSSSGGYNLKVELDLANNNVFTDMGTQALASVPFALAAETANTAKGVDGFPFVNTPTPVTGSRLVWNGGAWAPVKKDTIITRAGLIQAILSPGLNLPTWTFVSNAINSGYTDIPQITVTGNETIVVNATAVFAHNNTGTAVTASVGVCYQNIAGGTIEPFFPNNFMETSIPIAPTKIQLSATGSIKLPAGTYRIGMGIRNKSTTINIASNDYYNLVIEVRY